MMVCDMYGQRHYDKKALIYRHKIVCYLLIIGNSEMSGIYWARKNLPFIGIGEIDKNWHKVTDKPLPKFDGMI